MDILIPLTPLNLNKYAIVGIEDFDLANEKWFTLDRSLYARRSDRSKAFMHRIIFGRILNRPLENHEHVDHIDNNSLNNKRSNLRLATAYQNQLNKKGRGTSQFRGVSYDKESGKWAVQIHYDDISTYLGSYDNEILAAQIYDAAARLYLDKFVKLNFPDTSLNLLDFGIMINEKTNRPYKPKKINESGFSGIELLPNKTYRVRISADNKYVPLGTFKNLEQVIKTLEDYKLSLF